MVGRAMSGGRRRLSARAPALVLAALVLVLVAGAPVDARAGLQTDPSTTALEAPDPVALFGPATC